MQYILKQNIIYFCPKLNKYFFRKFNLYKSFCQPEKKSKNLKKMLSGHFFVANSGCVCINKVGIFLLWLVGNTGKLFKTLNPCSSFCWWLIGKKMIEKDFNLHSNSFWSLTKVGFCTIFFIEEIVKLQIFYNCI